MPIARLLGAVSHVSKRLPAQRERISTAPVPPVGSAPGVRPGCTVPRPSAFVVSDEGRTMVRPCELPIHTTFGAAQSIECRRVIQHPDTRSPKRGAATGCAAARGSPFTATVAPPQAGVVCLSQADAWARQGGADAPISRGIGGRPHRGVSPGVRPGCTVPCPSVFVVPDEGRTTVRPCEFPIHVAFGAAQSIECRRVVQHPDTRSPIRGAATGCAATSPRSLRFRRLVVQ